MSGKKTKQDPEHAKKQLKKLKKAAFDEIQHLNKTINWYEMVVLILCKRTPLNTIFITEKDSDDIAMGESLEKTFDEKTKTFKFKVKTKLVS